MSDDEYRDSDDDDTPGPAPLTGEAHADLDVEETLSSASVVVASNRVRNYTAESTPEWLETVVRTDPGRNVARNRGVDEASGEWIIVADDDITFPTTMTAMLVEGMSEHHVVGLEDFWPMDWLLTRYMVFHRSVWEAVGGFDEDREHGGDTDFCIRCEKAGARVCKLPRDVVPHHDVDTTLTRSGHLEWLYYLTRHHPVTMAPKLLQFAFQKAGLTRGQYG
ncbi:glycosyl transferase [Halobacterium sp. DL1]|jgi:glycosyltransferase involved in cell wall biosynthesis|nr:glycosyl transferase [Halobacterium sp. DL1]